MRKSLILIGLPLLLGGCGLPPALTAASWALDGVSYLVSGKSVTDHAISEVAAQDCALFRVVQERAICEDYEIDGNDGVTLTAAALSSDSVPLVRPPEISRIATGFGPGTIEGDQASSVAAFVPVAMRWQEIDEVTGRADGTSSKGPKARPADLAAPFAVIGSFADPDNATGLRDRHTALHAEIRTFEASGTIWHRVVVQAPLEHLRDAGFADAWLLPRSVRNETIQMAEAN